MSKRHIRVCVVAVVLLAVREVYGDFGLGLVQAKTEDRQLSATRYQDDFNFADRLFTDVGYCDYIDIADLHIDGEFIAAGDDNICQIRELPPLPSSTSLYLSAMMAVGAWHLTRSVKTICFNSLPEWYHLDATQFGHVYPFTFDYWPELPCVYITANQHYDRSIHFQSDRYMTDFSSDKEYFLTVADTRGPP